MPFHSQTLPNGLQIIGETSPSARSAALGFFVRTGARDETPDVCGVTHFLEHMVFKGTPRRSALDVNRDFDRIGADYNAFTSEENTVFYAAILPEYMDRAVDVLADILRPSLRGDDFDMEKNVIIEEIGMYEDQPTWSAFDHAKKTYLRALIQARLPVGSTFMARAVSYYSKNDEIGIRWPFPDKITFEKIDCYSWQDEYRFALSITDALDFGKTLQQIQIPAPGSTELPKRMTVAEPREYNLVTRSLQDICRIHVF